jgi:FAD binding domain
LLSKEEHKNMTVNSVQDSESSHNHSIVDVQQTSCCIVGGGPAGAVLALLLARQNIPVMLLEVHKDFDREFRGDTLHPSIDPTDKYVRQVSSDTGFLFLSPESAFGMNPGACILDASGL